MSAAAPTAATPRSPTIPAATVTAPSARGRLGKPGSPARRAELLPVPYFHVVFTLPAPVGAIAFQNKAAVYAILFRAAAETLRPIAADPRHLGAEIGGVAVLHSWGQAMQHHPHVHCIVPGGGLSPDRRRWIACPPGSSCRSRCSAACSGGSSSSASPGAFADGGLRFFGDLAPLAEPRAFAAHCAALRRIDWVVYAKPPFGGPEQVLAYLGRYTHRVAIANSRLVAMTDGAVSFRWKDYRQEGRRKVMTLEPAEFMRRFLLHVLPSGFHRIRHFGFLANGHRAPRLALLPPGHSPRPSPGRARRPTACQSPRVRRAWHTSPRSALAAAAPRVLSHAAPRAAPSAPSS